MSAQEITAAIRAIQRDAQLLDLMDAHRKAHEAAIAQLHTELAEVRDGLLALSRRIEAVTQLTLSSAPHPNIVKGIQPGDLTTCSACHGTGQAAPDVHAACSICNGTGQVVAGLHSVKVTP